MASLHHYHDDDDNNDNDDDDDNACNLPNCFTKRIYETNVSVYGHSLIIDPSLGMYQEIQPLGCIRKSIPRDISGNASLGMY